MAPAFHVRAGRMAGIDVTYDLIERPADEGQGVVDVMRRCRDEGYDGLNITHPFKEIAYAATSVDDPSVRRIAAVNTVLFSSDGSMIGTNTDFSGLCRRWRHVWPQRRPGVVALIGAGGAGRAIGFGVVELGARQLRVCDTDGDRAHALVGALRDRFPRTTSATYPDAESAVLGVDGVVNATPIGTYHHPGSPVDLDLIGDQKWVLDAVYSPLETPLLRRAHDMGQAAFNGFELFLGQGFDAFERFAEAALPATDAVRLEQEMWQQVERRDI